jgi:hypothetical protein
MTSTVRIEQSPGMPMLGKHQRQVEPQQQLQDHGVPRNSQV